MLLFASKISLVIITNIIVAAHPALICCVDSVVLVLGFYRKCLFVLVITTIVMLAYVSSYTNKLNVSVHSLG